MYYSIPVTADLREQGCVAQMEIAGMLVVMVVVRGRHVCGSFRYSFGKSKKVTRKINALAFPLLI